MARPLNVAGFFPFRRNPNRPFPWIALAVLVSLIVAWEVYSYRHARGEGRGDQGGRGPEPVRLAEPRKSPGAWGSAGDLVLTGPEGASLTFASGPDRPGRRPLVGALVDVALAPGDVADPLLYLRQVVVEGARARTYPFRYPQATRCAGGGQGVRSGSTIGEGLSTEVCAVSGNRFTFTTSGHSIAVSTWVADELDVGPIPIVVDRVGGHWSKEAHTRFVAFAAAGTAVLIEAPRMRLDRVQDPSGSAPVLIRYGPESTVERTLVVTPGDVLSAIAQVEGATRVVQVTFGPGRGGEVAVVGGGRVLAAGNVAPSETRTLRLPPDLGTHLELRDASGVVTDRAIPIPPPGGKRLTVTASTPEAATLALSYRDGDGAALPVRIVVEGASGKEAPTLRGVGPRLAFEGRSVSTLDGAVSLRVRPGKYRVTALHGLTHTVSVEEVEVSTGATTRVQGVLRKVVDTSGWLAVDPNVATYTGFGGTSPAERVVTLLAAGIDLAVGVDRERVADLGAAAHALGVAERLVTLPGAVVASTDTGSGVFGTFGAFPLPGAGADVPDHRGRRPEETFRSARDLGARAVAVLRPRSGDEAGYLDRVRFDPLTGRADPVFSSAFDLLEVFPGAVLGERDRVREGLLDLVGLARRGARVAAIGGSGSSSASPLRGGAPLPTGYPRTFVHVDREPSATRAARAVAGLLSRATTVTSGPFVELTVDGRGIGEGVTPASDSVRVALRVSAPAWIPLDHVELLRDGEVVERFAVTRPAVDGIRLERSIDVPVPGRDCVLHAWAEGDEPLPAFVPGVRPRSIGFTGLTWVDGDRDGKMVVPAAPSPAKARP